MRCTLNKKGFIENPTKKVSGRSETQKNSGNRSGNLFWVSEDKKRVSDSSKIGNPKGFSRKKSVSETRKPFLVSDFATIGNSLRVSELLGNTFFCLRKPEKDFPIGFRNFFGFPNVRKPFQIIFLKYLFFLECM
jgi:hypothetical protein